MSCLLIWLLLSSIFMPTLPTKIIPIIINVIINIAIVTIVIGPFQEKFLFHLRITFATNIDVRIDIASNAYTK